MEEEQNKIYSNPTEQQKPHKTPREAMKHGTPEDVKESVKETVAKGVAAVAGALKGFSEETKKQGLADTTKKAIQHAGDTTRDIATATKTQFKQTKDAIKNPKPTNPHAPNQPTNTVGSPIGSKRYGPIMEEDEDRGGP